jgi:hypothetical protein
MDFTEALMSAAGNEDDLSAPGKFCRKCWVPKPERVSAASHLSFTQMTEQFAGSSLRNLWALRFENGCVE